MLCIQDMVSYSTVTISCLSHGRTQEVVQKSCDESSQFNCAVEVCQHVLKF